LGMDSFDEDENTLTLDEFFEIIFGSDPLDFNSTQFITEELTVEMPHSFPSQVGLVTCTGRDFLVAFLNQVPEKAMSKILSLSSPPIYLFQYF
ncbi:9017_t:CDS:2, partial [Ambispora gerdemannii]